jgi:hypothetical protein
MFVRNFVPVNLSIIGTCIPNLVYEYTVTGRKKCTLARTRWRERCPGRWKSQGGLYRVDIEDDSNLLDMIHRLTLIPIK